MALSEHGIYQRWSDNVARAATITIDTGADPLDSHYGPAVLVDDNPAKVAKIDSTTGAWLFDFGAAKRVDLVGLIHHSFDAGADVTLQATNDVADFATSPPSPPFSASIVVPTWLGSGSGRWPVNPWLDLTAQAGYLASGWRYWRLLVVGNSQNLQLGQIWMSPTIRRFDPDVQWGVQRGQQRSLVQSRTAFGVDTIYARGTLRWSQSGQLRMTTDVYAADLETQWQDVEGRAKPWLLVPDGEVNVCYFVRWAGLDLQTQWAAPAIRDRQIQVEEVARGLRPGV
jgi:hypothetical protein